MGRPSLLRAMSMAIVCLWILSARAQAQSTPVLHPRISGWIQIDQAGESALNSADANLFSGADPGDASASYDKPAGSPDAYIDWDDLGSDLANHRLLDIRDATGKDSTAFPSSNECVGVTSVLLKLDITYAAVATNGQYAYIATQRADNSGDNGFYWLFTQLPPDLSQQGFCAAGQHRLMFSLSPSDVLIQVHFAINGVPMARCFISNGSATVNAISAVDFTNGGGSHWSEDPTKVAAVATNTTLTAFGSFGAAGVRAPIGSNIDVGLFSEVAFPISLLPGDSWFVSVISRSSMSGGTSPDLKDLAGPFEIAGLVTGVTAANPSGSLMSLPVPNPWSRTTRIRLVVPTRVSARVDVFDLAGRRVCVLAAEPLEAGEHVFAWSGRQDDGAQAPDGVYLVRASWPGYTETRKVLRVH